MVVRDGLYHPALLNGEIQMEGDGKAELKHLAQGIVLAQGNVFIKELLRDKGLRIGATKADFITSLNAAIDSGQLSSQDLEDWLHRVEGWGQEYVYLFKVPAAIANDPLWSDPNAVSKRVAAAGLKEFWEASSSLQFPERLKLTGVYFRDSQLRYIWHQGVSSWYRDRSKDYTEVVEDDRYEFRAYRQKSERTVMRFELRLQRRLAAAFVQIPVTSDEHEGALRQMWQVVTPLVDRAALEAFNVSNAIKQLDQLQLRSANGDLRTQQARMSGQGAYVEFGSTSPDRGYRDVDPIREVRLALKPEDVSGNTATIIFSAPADKGPGKNVRVQFYGDAQRIWLRAQMTEEQVWELLELIKDCG